MIGIKYISIGLRLVLLLNLRVRLFLLDKSVNNESKAKSAFVITLNQQHYEN